MLTVSRGDPPQAPPDALLQVAQLCRDGTYQPGPSAAALALPQPQPRLRTSLGRALRSSDPAARAILADAAARRGQRSPGVILPNPSSGTLPDAPTADAPDIQTIHRPASEAPPETLLQGAGEREAEEGPSAAGLRILKGAGARKSTEPMGAGEIAEAARATGVAAGAGPDGAAGMGAPQRRTLARVILVAERTLPALDGLVTVIKVSDLIAPTPCHTLINTLSTPHAAYLAGAGGPGHRSLTAP